MSANSLPTPRVPRYQGVLLCAERLACSSLSEGKYIPAAFRISNILEPL